MNLLTNRENIWQLGKWEPFNPGNISKFMVNFKWLKVVLGL